MTGREWLILVVVLAVVLGVGIPLLGSILRARDFKAQVKGRRPLRRYDKKHDPVEETPEARQKTLEMESRKMIAELKSKQNLLGPK